MSDSNYKKLKEVWYKKLEKAGFVDIEEDEFKLKVDSTKFARQESMKSYQTKIDYYYMANHFLNSYKFKSSFDRIVWEYHVEGIPSRDIAKILTKLKRKPIGRMTIWRVLKRLTKIMKLGLY
jgi:hypothetical protein